MPISLTRQAFLRSEVADELRQELQGMVNDPQYNTQLRFHDGSKFVEKHMAYMSNYLHMDHAQYVSNLKLMTRQK